MLDRPRRDFKGGRGLLIILAFGNKVVEDLTKASIGSVFSERETES